MKGMSGNEWLALVAVYLFNNDINLWKKHF